MAVLQLPLTRKKKKTSLLQPFLVIITEPRRRDLDMRHRKFCLIVTKGNSCDLGALKSTLACLDREAPAAGLTLAESGSLR